VLELFRSGLPAGDDPSAINLWPEHFDIAFEGGSQASGCAPTTAPRRGTGTTRSGRVPPSRGGYVGRVRLGVLTGGGDCPGLNAVIRAIVRKGIDQYGHAIVGFRDGWAGPLENQREELTIESTRGILPRGGTILGTSRTNPFKREGGPEQIRENIESLHLDGLIAIGGEDTLGAANRLHSEHQINVVGVPKTIDNDIGATDVTFGFDTALQVATEAIDRLHTTAESHHRVMVVEVMGRHAGWIALYSGVAGGGDVILIPEQPFDIEDVCRLIGRRHSRGRVFSIVVVAEGAVAKEGTLAVTDGETDEFGHVRLGGIGHRLEQEIETRTGFETRAVVLGHIQRGGTPTAYDRVLATRFGIAAIDAAHDGRWGTMPALRGTRIELVPLAEAVAELRTVSPEEYAVAEPFLG
jgi:ATP-dependent phosphofructokinase / diphosphate-dependent phosphofructokinase